MTSTPDSPTARTSAQRTRDALLDAAERLFAESGYHAVGIRDISGTAGTNVASISYHFGSKHDLYLAVMRRAFDERETLDAWRMLVPAPNDADAATALLVSFARRFATASLTGDQAQRLCRLLVREAWRPSDALSDIADRFFHPYEEHITAVIARIAPELDEATHRHHVRSLIGQLLFPTFFRPFIELSEGVALDDDAFVASHADHVARVTLRALDVPTARIDRAFEEAAP